MSEQLYQLGLLGLTPKAPPDAQTWQRLLVHLGQVFKQQEEKLTHAKTSAEVELRMIFDDLPGAVALIDADNRILMVNAAYARLFGRTVQQTVGRNLRELLGEALFAQTEPMRARMMQGEDVRFERNGTGPEGAGRRYQVQLRPQRDTMGAVRQHVGLLTDVTDVDDMRIAWQALAASEKKLSAALALSNSWYWETDAQGRYTAMECGSQPDPDMVPSHWLGRNKAAASERMGASVVPLELQASAPPSETPVGLRESRFKWVFQDGRERHWQEFSEPVSDAKGRLTGYCGTLREVPQPGASAPPEWRRQTDWQQRA